MADTETKTKTKNQNQIPLTRVVILGLVLKNPHVTGYDLMQIVLEEFKSHMSFKTGTLYAELRRLENMGYLISSQNPTGRKQRKYAITEAGEEELKRLSQQIKMRIEHVLTPLVKLIDSNSNSNP